MFEVPHHFVQHRDMKVKGDMALFFRGQNVSEMKCREGKRRV